MNAIKLLIADHRALQKLLKKVSHSSEKNTAMRKKLFQVIKHNAKLHEKMEEKYLYPYLLDFKKSRPNVFEHHEEVALMERLILQLSKTPVNKEIWTAKFTVFKEISDHHIEEEEDEKFPQAEKLLSTDLLNDIGTEMLKFKIKNKML